MHGRKDGENACKEGRNECMHARSEWDSVAEFMADCISEGGGAEDTRETQRDRERQRDTERQRDRERDTARHTEKQRETETNTDQATLGEEAAIHRASGTCENACAINATSCAVNPVARPVTPPPPPPPPPAPPSALAPGPPPPLCAAGTGGAEGTREIRRADLRYASISRSL